MRLTNRSIFVLLAVISTAGCVALPHVEPLTSPPAEQTAGMPAETESSMDAVAESYVKMVLALGQHDAGYVDAYYGPQEWKTWAETSALSLNEIARRSAALIDELRAHPPGDVEEIVLLRHHYLERQLEALVARIRMLQGEHLTFDEESRALYGAVAPTHPASYFQKVLDQLDRQLPGEGPISSRYEAYRKQFIIPPAKLDEVFRAAIDECRARTKAHVALPPGESFRIEYVTDKPWSAYNWYQGNYDSLIQVNTDLPIYIDRAIDLACHEGYPGHHVYNALLEKNLVDDRGWQEFTVYPLFSPQSLIAEGSANYGIEVAFPGNQRTEYESRKLFPLAGLDPAKAERYYRIQSLVDELSYAGNEAARQYLDGQITSQQAAEWLTRYQLMEPDRARQRVRFIDTYRAYVINYNLGKDLVRRYVESKGGTADHPDMRWQEFAGLLSSPRLPSDLQ